METLPTKILLATDGSEDSELAATSAVGLSKVSSLKLHVVYVGPEMPYYLRPTDAERANIEQEAARILEEQTRKLETLGATIAQRHLRLGRAAKEIVGLAEKLDVDLVAVGSRGGGRIKRLLMGSVSVAVLHHAHCLVLVVRRKPVVFPARILLATDGSEEAGLAASAAATLASRTGSELHVVHVGRLLTHGPYPGIDVGPLPGAHQDELAMEARKLLDAEVKRIKSSGVEVTEAHLREGGADVEIVALAEEIGADLVVIGSRGRGAIPRVLMGGVSDSVARHAHCPVLVMR